MKHLFQTVAAAAAIAITATPALAGTTASASASIGPLTITLFDLNTSDNVTPWITFSGGNLLAAFIPPDGQDLGDYGGGITMWDTNVVSVNQGGNQAQASISGNGTATGTIYAASGSGSHFSASAYNDFLIGNFTLSAGTLLLVTGSASVSAMATNTISGDMATYAVLELTGAGSLGSGSQTSKDELLQQHVAAPGFADASWSESRSLSASFTNLTNTSLDGGIRLEATVYSQLVAAPVPEPETYALMLAGLAAIGMLARRRS